MAKCCKNSRPSSWITLICVVVRQWHPTPVLLPGKFRGRRSLVGCSPWGLEESDMTDRLHFHFHALEKQMATHSSVLAWRIPGTGEPGRLPSMGSHRVGHNWCSLAAAAATAAAAIPKQYTMLANIYRFSTIIYDKVVEKREAYNKHRATGNGKWE